MESESKEGAVVIESNEVLVPAPLVERGVEETSQNEVLLSSVEKEKGASDEQMDSNVVSVMESVQVDEAVANRSNDELVLAPSVADVAVIESNEVLMAAPAPLSMEEESIAQPAVDEQLSEAVENAKMDEESPVVKQLPETGENAKISEEAPMYKQLPEADATVIKQPLEMLVPSALPGMALSLLAQYDSDNESHNESDTDSVIEVISAPPAKDYRNQVVEINSDSDDSSSDSEVEYLAEIRKAIDKRMVDDDDDDEDEDGGGKTHKRQPPKVRGEMLLDDLPPIQDLHITVPEAECVELGRIHSIVDQLVLVNALPNSVLLDLETVLFLEKGQKALGEVFDVLGQVADPLYCVRFNSNQQILEKSIKVGDVVYVAPKTEHTQFIILSNLIKFRGSDASWENDVEPPMRYMDYSDDEQERDARAQLRNKDRPTDHNDPTKRARSEVDQTPSPSASPSPMHQRGRGGNSYRPRHSYPHNQHNPQQGYHHSGYNPGSWHSNYSQPPPNYPMQPPPRPQQYQRHHTNQMYGPPPQFNAYQQAAPPPMYVLNPYAARGPMPPQQGPPGPMYSRPPPPPPGSQ